MTKMADGRTSDSAGLVMGARVPIILTSRADSADSRLASCAVAVAYANWQKEGRVKKPCIRSSRRPCYIATFLPFNRCIHSPLLYLNSFYRAIISSHLNRAFPNNLKLCVATFSA